MRPAIFEGWRGFPGLALLISLTLHIFMLTLFLILLQGPQLTPHGCNSLTNNTIQLERCQPSLSVSKDNIVVGSLIGADLDSFKHWLHSCYTERTCPVHVTKHCHWYARFKDHGLCFANETELVYLRFAVHRFSKEDTQVLVDMMLNY